MKDQHCPKCDGTQIMADIEVRDWGSTGAEPLRVYIPEPEPEKHGFIWQQGESSGEVRAWICANCGYTELYTDNLAELYATYQKSH